MDKRVKNVCSTPIPGDTIKDYSLPLSRINSTSSDNKSNPGKSILKRKKKRSAVNNFVRHRAVRLLDSDTDTEDNWVTDWEEAIDSHSKTPETSDDKKTSESTGDSKKPKKSQRKIIFKRSSITTNSSRSSTEATSKVRGILKGSKKYTSPELIRDAVHADNLFLEKFDQPLTDTSNLHFRKYTPRVDAPIHSKEEAERCKGDEFLPIEKLPLQLPSALHYFSSDDEFTISSGFVKRGDRKTYEKRPAIVNKRKEIPSKNKTITQTETIKWIYPKYWLRAANLLWDKFKKISSSSVNDSSVNGNGSFAIENSFNDVSSDTIEISNTSSQTENEIQVRQKKRVKKFRKKRISVNENINPTVNIRSVNETIKSQKSLVDDTESNVIFKTKHIPGGVNKKGMATTKKILKRNYKKAIPVTDDDDSVLELENRRSRRKIRKIRKANPQMRKHNDKSITDSMLSDEKDNMKLLKWHCLEMEDGPWRYDCKENYKVRMELQPLDNTAVESQYAVKKKIQPGPSALNNKKPRIVSVERITTRYTLVSGQSRRLLGPRYTEGQ